MPSVSRTAHLLAIGGLVAALSLVAAQPAMAFSDPPTLTVTPNQPDEGQNVEFSGECPTGSTSVHIEDQNGGGYGIAGSYFNATDGTFNTVGSGGWHLENTFARGTAVTFTATCLDASNGATGTVDAIFHMPDSGASVAAPSPVPINQGTTATGNCGTSANVTQYYWRLYNDAGAQIDSAFNLPYNGTNYSIPIAAGDTYPTAGAFYTLYVYCESTSPTSHVASNRGAKVVFGAAAATLPSFAATAAHPDENASVTFSGVCPATSLSATLDLTGTYSGGGPSSEQIILSPLLAGDSWSYTTSFPGNNLLRGSTVNATVTCYDGAVVNGAVTGAATGTVAGTYHLADVGAALTLPSAAPINSDLTITGNCGTSTTIASITWSLFNQGNVLVDTATVAYTNAADYSIVVPNGASYGLTAGQNYSVSVECTATAPSTHRASLRTVGGIFAVAVVAPSTGAGLASTGFDAMAPLTAGGILVAAGAIVLVLRRRRGDRAPQTASIAIDE